MQDNSHHRLLVENSLSEAAWQQFASVYPLAETERRAEGLADLKDMPLALAYYLAAHGMESNEIDNFISPRLRDSLPDPHLMQDAERAITLICNAIEAKQPIGIFGDYDVDGACSAALFRAVGVNTSATKSSSAARIQVSAPP